MARPRKARKHKGVELEQNLYANHKGDPDLYLYRYSNGGSKVGRFPTPEEANAQAALANARGGLRPTNKKSVPRTSIAYYLPAYIEKREKKDSDLKKKSSWRNRKYMLNGFVEHLSPLSVGQIDRDTVERWWDDQGYHKQKLARAELRRFFSYLMGRGLLPRLKFNPFTTDTNKPLLYSNSKPARSRERMDLQDYWTIYNAAGELELYGLQIAMGISLQTFMREGDICSLRHRSNVKDGYLKKIINKSRELKGDALASRLQWNLNENRMLRDLIQKSRELSLKNGGCPYVISHMPKVKKTGKTKTHFAQVTERRIQSMFNEARDATGLKWRHPPTFHEVRALANRLAKEKGYSKQQIMLANAHSSEKPQEIYQSMHELPFDDSPIRFDPETLGWMV